MLLVLGLGASFPFWNAGTIVLTLSKHFLINVQCSDAGNSVTLTTVMTLTHASRKTKLQLHCIQFDGDKISWCTLLIYYTPTVRMKEFFFFT